MTQQRNPLDLSRLGVEPAAPVSAAIHRFATVLACLVVFLIAAGALVKSKEAGLSVPDWPLSYGSLSPPHWWRIDTVRAEHGHRMFAGTIALLTVLLAILLQRGEQRAWVRRLGWSAVGAVLAQAVLGGVTVLLFLPPAVSIAHAGLAELFLCLMTSIAVVTARSFWAAPEGAISSEVGGVATLATATTAMIYVQILLGAVMRHNGAGLAIPDFPLAFGRLVPPHFDFKIGIHYAHRLGALTVAVLVLWTASRVLSRFRAERTLALPALGMVGLVALQITLGALVVLTRKAVLPNTVHVATGASLLATSLVLSLRGRRLARAARRAEPARSASASRRAQAPTREAVS
ncbi:MAG: heme a synthase [Acidobacteriota bacterium]|jgi:cytochrome c oxidase assembly protein subunit 15|nr:heme a synthase [Acidobacteriota bacterium]